MPVARDLLRIAGALAARGSPAPRPRAASKSATANGIAPPPATMPTGEEMSAAAVSWLRPSLFMPSAVSAGSTARVLAVADEVEDFRDRRILARPRLHGVEPFGKHAGTVKQLL